MINLEESIKRGELFSDLVAQRLSHAFLMGPTLTALESVGVPFDTSGIIDPTLKEIMSAYEPRSDKKRIFTGLRKATAQHFVDLVIGIPPDDARNLLGQVYLKYKTAFYEGVIAGIKKAKRANDQLIVTPVEIFQMMPFLAEPFACAVSGVRLTNSGYYGKLGQALDIVFDAQEQARADQPQYLAGIVEARVPSIFGALNLEEATRDVGIQAATGIHDHVFQHLSRRGVKLVIAETIESGVDAEAIAKVAQAYNLKVLLSLNVNSPNKTPSEEKVITIFNSVLDHYGDTVQALGLNCSPYAAVKGTLEQIQREQPGLMRYFVGTWINGGERQSAAGAGMERHNVFIRDGREAFMERYHTLRNLDSKHLGKLGSCCCATGPDYFQEIVADTVRRRLEAN